MAFTLELPLLDDGALARAEAWAAAWGARDTTLSDDGAAFLALLDRAPDPTTLAALGDGARVREAVLVDDDSTWSEARRPIVIGPLTVALTGAPVSATSVVRLDRRGRAFGSGLHATTRMCLERLVSLSPVGSMLDVGTGSGILALAALALGAEHAVGLEVDAAARAEAQANAAANGLALELHDGDALYDEARRFELVIANILGPELMALAPAVVRTLASDATLLLCGIRPGLEAEVTRAYQRLGLAPLSRDERDGWVMVELLARW